MLFICGASICDPENLAHPSNPKTIEKMRNCVYVNAKPSYLHPIETQYFKKCMFFENSSFRDDFEIQEKENHHPTCAICVASGKSWIPSGRIQVKWKLRGEQAQSESEDSE